MKLPDRYGPSSAPASRIWPLTSGVPLRVEQADPDFAPSPSGSPRARLARRCRLCRPWVLRFALLLSGAVASRRCDGPDDPPPPLERPTTISDRDQRRRDDHREQPATGPAARRAAPRPAAGAGSTLRRAVPPGRGAAGCADSPRRAARRPARVVGVGADEAASVGVARQEVPLLVLDRPQVSGADLGRRLDLGEIDLAAVPRLAKRVSDALVHAHIVARWRARARTDRARRPELGARPPTGSAVAAGAIGESTRGRSASVISTWRGFEPS